MEKLMSCDTNTEIMESLFEQVQEEYPDLTIEQQATIASQRFWNLAQQMKLRQEELRYLDYIMCRVNSFTQAQGEQLLFSNISHKEIQSKIVRAIKKRK